MALLTGSWSMTRYYPCGRQAAKCSCTLQLGSYRAFDREYEFVRQDDLLGSFGRRPKKPVPRNERVPRAMLAKLQASDCRYFFSGAVTVIVTGRLGMETSVFGFWVAFGSLL